MYSLSASYDGNYAKGFANGVNYSDSTNYNAAITTPISSTHLILGADPTGTTTDGNHMKGNIYSIRFYNRALTTAEVQHNYHVDQELFYLYD